MACFPPLCSRRSLLLFSDAGPLPGTMHATRPAAAVMGAGLSGKQEPQQPPGGGSSSTDGGAERFSVLGWEQVQRLNQILEEAVPIHGRGNFPTLAVRPRRIVQVGAFFPPTPCLPGLTDGSVLHTLRCAFWLVAPLLGCGHFLVARRSAGVRRWQILGSPANGYFECGPWGCVGGRGI